jgi:hypothetical protein
VPSQFADVPRGKPLQGPREIADYIWGDRRKWRSVYQLDRDAFGIKMVAGQLLGFEKWIEAGLRAAETSRRRRK